MFTFGIPTYPLIVGGSLFTITVILASDTSVLVVDNLCTSSMCLEGQSGCGSTGFAPLRLKRTTLQWLLQCG